MTWRNWELDWTAIFSVARSLITGFAEALTGDQPESVAGEVIYFSERQQQCP
jgi:hypothetical protein